MMTDIHYGRKRSGIERELKKKIDDWLESIEDKVVQELARKNTIVTGGAIASMLIGEKINDFDIYFRNLETARQVAWYYVEKFNQARKESQNKIEYTPEVKILDRTNIRGETETRVVIWMQSAGVCAEDQSGYSYFELKEDKSEMEDFAESTLESKKDDKPRYRPVFLSENAVTLSDKIQLVTRFYGAPDDIHKNYDFVHATCWWDHKREILELPAKALECLLSRTLIYQGSLYPVASIFRAKKFIERGWRITAGQLMKIMWQISEIDLKDMPTIREQLTGVDMAYMWELIQAISQADPEKINSTYIATIIDRIFE